MVNGTPRYAAIASVRDRLELPARIFTAPATRSIFRLPGCLQVAARQRCNDSADLNWASGPRHRANQTVLRSTSWFSAHSSCSVSGPRRPPFGPRLRIGGACPPASKFSHCRSQAPMGPALAWPLNRCTYFIFPPQTIHRSRRNPKVPGVNGAEVSRTIPFLSP